MAIYNNINGEEVVYGFPDGLLYPGKELSPAQTEKMKSKSEDGEWKKNIHKKDKDGKVIEDTENKKRTR